MKVLFAVWELAPFFKFGGLGDVARSLPVALKKLGVDIRVVLPQYKAVRFGRVKKHMVAKLKVDFAGKKEKVEIYQVFHPLNRVPVYFLKNKNYLDVVEGIDTFAFFNKVVVEMVEKNYLSFVPDIIHCNDLHTGLIPLLAKLSSLPVKTVFTIHNLAHQGRTSVDILDKLGIERRRGRIAGWEIKSRQINFLMEGIIHADIISTVSPTYAKEIMTEEFGMGLEEILRGREGKVFGILNGINVETRQSGEVHNIHVAAFHRGENSISDESIRSYLEKKMENKLSLQRNLGLKVSDKIPLSCFIGRLDPRQKGLDIFHKMLRRIDVEEQQFVLLGSGNKDWEDRFQWLATFYPKSISCNFKFDETLALKLYTSCDFIIIPSKFEPCGLIQMLAMYFGTIPIAHRTGGLIDSIKDDINGFLFDRYTSLSLEHAFLKGIDIWGKHKIKYLKMVKAALFTDFSWAKSAKEYLGLYEKLVSEQFS